MKTRTGFVSNSSSSSFIVGIGKILNVEKFDKYIVDNNIKLDKFDTKKVRVGDIKNERYSEARRQGDSIVVESFATDVRISSKGLNDEDTLLVVNISNNEGDSYFVENEDDYEINYNIDYDFFDKNQQKIYDLFTNSNSGVDVKNAEVTYGAARNG